MADLLKGAASQSPGAWGRPLTEDGGLIDGFVAMNRPRKAVRNGASGGMQRNRAALNELRQSGKWAGKWNGSSPPVNPLRSKCLKVNMAGRGQVCRHFEVIQLVAVSVIGGMQ